MDLKPGTKLRCIRGSGSDLNESQIYTVAHYGSGSSLIVLKYFPYINYLLDRFTPVPTIKRKNNG